MKIVIDIDENVFVRLFDNGIEDYAIANDDLCTIAKAVRNGTPYEERPIGEWISIGERLPNRNGVYYVTRIIEGTPIIWVCYFDGSNTWHDDNRINHGRTYLNDVVAWMPRPEPYKKEAENES